MEEPDENSDVDDLFLPFVLSRAIQSQNVHPTINPSDFETSGEYVEIVLDGDSTSSDNGADSGRIDPIRSPLEAQADGGGGDSSSLCPSPSPLSSGNHLDSQDLSLANRNRNDTPSSQHHRNSILEKFDSFDSVETDRDDEGMRERKDSILDGLLCEIYDRCHPVSRSSVDSDGFTECSSDGAYLSSKGDSFQESSRLPKALLNAKTTTELLDMVRDLQHGTAVLSGRLIKQLKRRDRYIAKRQKNQDVLTAMLQAVSQKRRVDAQLRFSIEPLPGKKAFRQWYDALRAVARLPFGLPQELRKAVWLTLADKHIKHLKLDWEKTVKVAFNDHSNPDDDKLGVQIVKDLHRTGCSGFCGQGAEEDRVVLKRVLLAYARWNKSVGYCQGFNVIAALILEVMERMEDDALKVMIFLIDHVLPDSYFANNLRALSVDMAVFRELLHFKLPDLAQHLDKLQKSANDGLSGSYEPPLTNVFTMQWFLTLFATCLPKRLVLRVWDTLFLEGSEVLLRVALAIWAKLSQPLLDIKSADEFYSRMSVLCNEMLQNQLLDGDDLIQTIYSMASFPFPHLNEIREKYMFSITPFSPLGALEKTTSSNESKSPVAAGPKRKEGPRGYSRPSGSQGSHSDEETEFIEDVDLANMTCFPGLFPPPAITDVSDRSELQRAAANDITRVSPGAYSTSSEDLTLLSAALTERMTMDVNALKRQYLRIQRRQMRAHVIYGPSSITEKRAFKPVSHKKNVAVKIESPAVVNHLLVGKTGLGKKNAKITSSPQIALPLTGGYDEDDDVSNKRVHVNTKPNVKQALQAKGEEREGDGSEQGSVFSEEGSSSDRSGLTNNGGGRLTSRNDSSVGEPQGRSMDGDDGSQESLGPEIGPLIDLGWGLDEESGEETRQSAESHQTAESRSNAEEPVSTIGSKENLSHSNSTTSLASVDSRDVNDNEVLSLGRSSESVSDTGKVTPRSTSTETSQFNCAIEAYNPRLPGAVSTRRVSEMPQPPASPRERVSSWGMAGEANGSARGGGGSSRLSSSHSYTSISSWGRRRSSGSSSCDEPASPPSNAARVPTFNPFPKRALRSSENRNRTRMKLGLYPAKTKARQDQLSPRDNISTEQLTQDMKRSVKLGS